MPGNIFTLTQGIDDNNEKINQSDRTYKKIEETILPCGLYD